MGQLAVQFGMNGTWQMGGAGVADSALCSGTGECWLHRAARYLRPRLVDK